MIDFRKLVQAGVHFGHQKMRWCPKMEKYIWGYKNNVYLIDVAQTASQLEKAARFLEETAAQGKPVLWVGTKKAARDVVKEAASQLEMPFVVHRWIGGTFSNNSQVKKSVTKLLHHEDVLAKSESFHYTKKELTVFRKMVERLSKNVGGLRSLTWPVGAVVLVDVRKEHSALKEASKMGIPVIALVDTNSDPSLVDYVIPANDDAPRSIKVLIDYLAEAAAAGKAKAAARKVELAAERKAKGEQEKTDKQIMQEAVVAMLSQEEEAPATSRPAGRAAAPRAPRQGGDRGPRTGGSGRGSFKPKKD